MRAPAMSIVLTFCVALLVGCSSDDIVGPDTGCSGEPEAGHDHALEATGADKATCGYLGKDHKLLAPDFRSIGLTLCWTHFPVGSEAREAVRLMVEKLNRIEGTAIEFYIAGSAPHAGWEDAKAEEEEG